MLEGRELEAAAVASRLKDFHAQPERFGPRYLQGVEPLPDGRILLRFAQGKFPAAMSLTEPERRELRLAAGEFVRRVCLWNHADHYQVLCARREAAQESIKENYHLLMGLLHPDRQESGSQAWPEACAQRVNFAYDILGDGDARRDYDALLHAAQPRLRASPPREGRRRASEARFAITLIAVGAVVAALIVLGLVVDDDEWGERSLLHASLSRLRTHPAPGSDHPRYVGSTVATSPRASDAVYDEPEPFALLKPLLRRLTGEEPKAFAPAPQLEPPVVIAQAPPADDPARPGPAVPAPSLRATPVLRSMPAAAAVPAAAVASAAETSRTTNREIEDLVVALVDFYQAGDTERLLGLLEPNAGFWRTEQMRHAYSDFFRSTRARRLSIEKLAWNSETGTAHAKGEATVHAEYFDQSAPVERRVEMELDIVLRDGRARIRRLSLFPDAR